VARVARCASRPPRRAERGGAGRGRCDGVNAAPGSSVVSGRARSVHRAGASDAGSGNFRQGDTVVTISAADAAGGAAVVLAKLILGHATGGRSRAPRPGSPAIQRRPAGPPGRGGARKHTGAATRIDARTGAAVSGRWPAQPPGAEPGTGRSSPRSPHWPVRSPQCQLGRRDCLPVEWGKAERRQPATGVAGT